MMQDWTELREQLAGQLDLSRDISEQELREQITAQVGTYAKSHLLTLAERQQCEQQIYNSFRKLDVLQELIDDPAVTEIMVNGPEHIFYERAGQLYPWEHGDLSEEKLSDMIQQIVGRANRRVNDAQPIVDTRLSNGSRVNVVLAPISMGGSSLVIRKFPEKAMSLERLQQLESLDRETAEFLSLLVQGGYNIMVSGGTGSGKTTFLNALSEQIPKAERVITIEDSAELQMKSLPNLVSLEARPENGSGSTPITIRDLIRTALRMRPDRIIVGEVRGPEALDMLQAMNTGHDGSLSTGHANSCEDMLARLETMVLMGDTALPLDAIRRQIASGIDIMVHLGRMRDKSRKMLQIVELNGMKRGMIQLNPLYRFYEEGEKGEKVHGVWKREGTILHRQKFLAAGMEEAIRPFL